MNTRIVIAATIAALSLATTAFAGAGNGNPFPFHAPGIEATGAQSATDDGRFGGYTFGFDNRALPTNGQNSAVQSANSMPRPTTPKRVAFVPTADFIRPSTSSSSQRRRWAAGGR